MTEEKKKKETKKKRPTERYVPSFTLGKIIYESAIHLGRPVFLSWDGKKFFRHQKVDFGLEEVPDEIYLPLKKEMYPYRPYVQTMELQELNKQNPTRQEAYNAVYKQFDVFLDLEKEFKALNTSTTLETYEQHKVSSLGYPFGQGDNDSGKTRGLEVHNALDYRTLFSSGLPSADVFNFIGYHKEGTGTILEDEADTLSRKYDREKLKIYRSGYRKGATCPRIIEPSSKDRAQRFYKTFCSKIFAGLYLPKDKGFRQRCLPYTMIEGYPEKDEITEEDLRIMDKIKFGLLIWRMKNYWIPLPSIELKLRGRIKELWKSKLQVVHELEHENYIRHLSLASAREKARKRAESLEAYITKSLFKVGAQSEVEIPFITIWTTLLMEFNLLDKDTGTDSIKCPALGYNLTKKAVGGRLRSVFSGQSFLRHKSGRTWKFDKDKLERLWKKFHINGLNE